MARGMDGVFVSHST